MMNLLNWAVVFLLIALAAGLVGFTGIAREATGIARMIFFIFLIFFIISLVQGYVL